MNHTDLKKYLISIILGWVCFWLSNFPITIDSAYDLYLLPGLLLPAVVALCYGMRYAIACCTLGLAIFSPFIVVPTNGWGDFVTAAFIFLWAAGLGMCRDKIEKGQIPFFALYIFQVLLVVVYFLCNKALVQFFVSYNPPFWCPNYTFSYLPENLINANATVLAETMTICALLANSVLSLPFVKRFLKIKTNGYEKNNYFVMIITVFMTTLLATFSSNGMINGMMSISFTVNAYQSNIGNMQFVLLKAAAILLLGDFLMHYLEYHNRQEQKSREMAETQQAVFESSDDMIWCVNGQNEKIVTCNSVAKSFFEAKADVFNEQNFFKLFSDEDAILWNDYFDETKKSGHHIVEYYDAMSECYYQVHLHRIDLSAEKYNIAVFAKNITDDILFEDQTRRMNDELEMKVLERTQEMRNAYNEMENMCYIIAHEFKSPIRAISLYNNILGEEIGSCFTKEANDASLKISMYCNKALNMIGEILKYSKMKSSRLALARVNMNKLIEDIIEELRMIYNTHDIHINMDRMPNVMGDEILLRCCIYNILLNSVKYSAGIKFTDIHVFFKDTKDEYVFYFKDNGVGFDMEYASDPFQMFNRLHADIQFEGNGIGLATVKNIVEKHGGKIGIDAKVNEGCTVFFTIPK